MDESAYAAYRCHWCLTVYGLTCQVWLNHMAAFLRPKPGSHSFISSTSFFPPLQLFVYLSIHVTLHFLLLFSAVFFPDPLVSLERCMWISGRWQDFSPNNLPLFYERLTQFSLKLLNTENPTLQRARVQRGSSPRSPSPSSAARLKEKNGIMSIMCFGCAGLSRCVCISCSLLKNAASL